MLYCATIFLPYRSSSFFNVVFSPVYSLINCSRLIGFFQLNNPLPAFWMFEGLTRKLSSFAKCIQHFGVCAVLLRHLFFFLCCFYIEQHFVYCGFPHTVVSHNVLNFFSFFFFASFIFIFFIRCKSF